MFKNKLILEVKGKDDRIYQLMTPNDAPLGELHDAIHTMKMVVVNQIQEQMKKEEIKEEPKEENCEEECQPQN